MKIIFFLLVGLFQIISTQAQDQLSHFINNSGDGNSLPQNFIEYNGKLFFEATSEDYGNEIWVTDGTTANTTLLKDINPGPGFGINYFFKNTAVIFKNNLYFIAHDGNSDGELWKTDGTSEGTQKVTHFLNNNIQQLTIVGQSIYFIVQANDSLQVWKSDGSEAGTLLVKRGLPIWSNISFQGKCNDTFIFTFQNYGSNYSMVWRSDGTDVGTFPITDDIDGNGSYISGTSGLSQYIEFGNKLYFVSRYYLYQTDGTLANTNILHQINDGSWIRYGDILTVNGKLYISLFSWNSNMLAIWESDGTSNNTKQIYLGINSNYFMPSNLASSGSSLIFCGPDSKGGSSLLSLDLNDYSKKEIKELEATLDKPSFFQSNWDNCNIVSIESNRFFISSPHLSYNKKGWVLDLTENNIVNIANLDNVMEAKVYKNNLFFQRYSSREGVELWKSDGTNANSILLANINKGKFGLSNPKIISLNDNLLFTANDGITGEELWIYNNISHNLGLVKDIATGSQSAYINSMVNYNSMVYFAAADGMYATKLWKTDGTSEGTVSLYDAATRATYSDPIFVTPHNDYLYFIATINRHANLCKTDGTTLTIIKDFGTNTYGVAFQVTGLTFSGDRCYCSTKGENEDLWVSDGTTDGTTKLINLRSITNLTDLQGKLYFTGGDLKGDIELWSSDGSIEGTSRVKDIYTKNSSSPNYLSNFNNQLFFTATTSEYGREIWKSDGTESGTQLLADIYKGSIGSIGNPNFCISGNKLYFTADDGIHGAELWKTDGTAAGTLMLRDMNEGPNSSLPSQLKSINNDLFFEAYDSKHGCELWKTNGEESGTMFVADILDGIPGGMPTKLTLVGKDLFFFANTNNEGNQLWKISTSFVENTPIVIQNESFTLSPNPSHDFIDVNTYENWSEIDIYNVNGKLMQSFDSSKGNRISISNLQPGIYIAKLKVNGKTFVKKLVKE